MDSASPKPRRICRLIQLATTTALIVVGILPLLWPGDTPWINDEPLLLHKAMELHSHPERFLSIEGLRGTVGLTYGPVAVWIYSILLCISRDPVILVELRAALFMAMVVVSFLWLGTSLPRLPRWGGIPFIASPYVWVYSRQIWDNTFLIPFGALSFAAYVSFLRHPKPWKLWITFLSLCLCGLTHLMSLPLALAITVHAIVYYRDWLRGKKRLVAAMVLIACALALPWMVSNVRGLFFVKGAVSGSWPAPELRAPSNPSVQWSTVLSAPMMGGRLLSAHGFDYFLGGGWWRHTLWLPLFYFVTWGGYGLTWAGLAMGCFKLRNGFRSKQPKDLDAHLSLIVVAVIAANCLMQWEAWRYPHPHYHNGIWIASVYLAWVATGISPRNRYARVGARLLCAGYAISMIVVLSFVMMAVHQTAGNRGIHFGPVLGTQAEVARSLNAFHPDSPLSIQVDNYRMFPHALPVLRDLVGVQGGGERPIRNLGVRHRNPAARDGWLVVEMNPIKE